MNFLDPNPMTQVGSDWIENLATQMAAGGQPPPGGAMAFGPMLSPFPALNPVPTREQNYASGVEALKRGEGTSMTAQAPTTPKQVSLESPAPLPGIEGSPLDPTPEQPPGAPMDIRPPAQQQQAGAANGGQQQKGSLTDALKGLKAFQKQKPNVPAAPAAPHPDVRALGHADPLKMMQLMQMLSQPGQLLGLAQLIGR